MENKRDEAIKTIEQKLGKLDSDSYITQLIELKNQYTDKFLCWLANALSVIKINKDTVKRLKSVRSSQKHIFYGALAELIFEYKFFKAGYNIEPILPKSKRGATPDFIVTKDSTKISIEVSITDLNDIKPTEDFDERLVNKILDRVIEKQRQSKELIIIQNRSFFNYIIKKDVLYRCLKMN
ncbi:MAG: hypothetical protein QXD02_00775 [Candidatus Parvarchaeum sp.]|nr:hypothetical protein [Candidatus Parvarchaeota archaeon]MCW1295954.1 hypothetical protein [Candidatus Parvarchaeum tengchongense]MCW1298842.1 hypothetical protein [Candidatus Parvarchaeum tengchongense]